MSFLANIGGILPGAYAGYTKGASDAVALQERQDEAATNQMNRQAQRDIMPLQTQANTLKAQAAVDEGTYQAGVAPQRRALDKSRLDSDTALAPGAASLAASTQTLALDKAISDKVAAVQADATLAHSTQESIAGMGGEAISRNDMTALNRTIGHMIKAPGVFPGLDGQPVPVNSQVITAPPGAKDRLGNPITGQAVQMTLEDGTTRLINASQFTQAYTKQRAAETLKGSYTLKDGENRLNGLNEVVAKGQPKLPPSMYYDEDGKPIYMGNGAGGVGGAGGGGAGGKAPPAPSALAVTAFKDIASGSESKLTDEQFAAGQDFAGRLMSQGAQSPEQAARTALAIAKNPDKATTSLNFETGVLERQYSSPDFANGRKIRVGPVLATEKYEPGVMANFAKSQLAHELQIVPADSRAAAEKLWLDTAKNPALIEQAVQQITSKSGSAAGQAMRSKLELIGQYGPKTTAAAQAVVAAGSKDSKPVSAQMSAGGLVPRMTQVDRQQALATERARLDTEKTDKAAAAPVTAKALLDEGNLPKLARFQAGSDFNLIPRDMQMAIYNKVNGVR